VAYEIDIPVGEVAVEWQRLQSWAARSLTEALKTAAVHPYGLPTLPQHSEYARILEFAEGRGICLLEIDDANKRIIVRLIQPPR
jgi:hypothetical protein